MLSTTIDKHVHVIINHRNAIFGQGIDDPFAYRIRLSYSSTENVQSPDELNHPIVKEALKLLDIDEPMDIATMADVPAGTGLGSSGTFSVALLHALHEFKGEQVGPEQLAEEAAHIEIDILERPVGKQDHYAAAFGGLNMISFASNGKVSVEPVASEQMARNKLFPSVMLLYTGINRRASAVLTEQNANALETKDDLVTIRDHAFQLKILMQNGFSPQQIGEVLHKTWIHKRKLANNITNDRIDSWYQTAMDVGALGGKICGAGGGGFLLLIVDPEKRGELREALSELKVMEIGYEPQGSRVVCRGE